MPTPPALKKWPDACRVCASSEISHPANLSAAITFDSDPPTSPATGSYNCPDQSGIGGGTYNVVHDNTILGILFDGSSIPFESKTGSAGSDPSAWLDTCVLTYRDTAPVDVAVDFGSFEDGVTGDCLSCGVEQPDGCEECAPFVRESKVTKLTLTRSIQITFQAICQNTWDITVQVGAVGDRYIQRRFKPEDPPCGFGSWGAEEINGGHNVSFSASQQVSGLSNQGLISYILGNNFSDTGTHKEGGPWGLGALGVCLGLRATSCIRDCLPNGFVLCTTGAWQDPIVNNDHWRWSVNGWTIDLS